MPPVTPQKSGNASNRTRGHSSSPKSANSLRTTSPYFSRTRRLVTSVSQSESSTPTVAKPATSKRPTLCSACTSDDESANSSAYETDTTNGRTDSESDSDWFRAELSLLADPLYSYYLRKYTQIFTALHKAKPSLIQERVGCDPWKLLIAVMLLNKTAGKLAIPVFWDIMDKWPTPKSLSTANAAELIPLIRDLGLQHIRANRLIALSSAYMVDPPALDRLRESKVYMVPAKDEILTGETVLAVRTRYPPTPISHLPGSGPYALDSYRIFCLGGEEWKSVMPADKELIRYLKWKWAFYERLRWDPVRGLCGAVDMHYLKELPALLYS